MKKWVTSGYLDFLKTCLRLLFFNAQESKRWRDDIQLNDTRAWVRTLILFDWKPSDFINQLEIIQDGLSFLPGSRMANAIGLILQLADYGCMRNASKAFGEIEWFLSQTSSHAEKYSIGDWFSIWEKRFSEPMTNARDNLVKLLPALIADNISYPYNSNSEELVKWMCERSLIYVMLVIPVTAEPGQEIDISFERDGTVVVGFGSDERMFEAPFCTNRPATSRSTSKRRRN